MPVSAGVFPNRLWGVEKQTSRARLGGGVALTPCEGCLGCGAGCWGAEGGPRLPQLGILLSPAFSLALPGQRGQAPSPRRGASSATSSPKCCRLSSPGRPPAQPLWGRPPLHPSQPHGGEVRGMGQSWPLYPPGPPRGAGLLSAACSLPAHAGCAARRRGLAGAGGPSAGAPSLACGSADWPGLELGQPDPGLSCLRTGASWQAVERLLGFPPSPPHRPISLSPSLFCVAR